MQITPDSQTFQRKEHNMATAIQTQPSLEARVEKVLNRFIKNNELFTTLDVSNAVKKDGGPFSKHEPIAAIARGWLANNMPRNYIDTMISVQGGNKTASLFMPRNKSASDYTTTDQQALAPRKGKVAVNHPVITARAAAPAAIRSDKYIEVPKEIWQKAGFVAGKQYIVAVYPNSLMMYPMNSSSKYQSKFKSILARPGSQLLEVPKAGRFRVSPSLLADANLTNCAVDFCQYTDKLVVARK
jgi:hypothetical protein